MTEGWIKLHRRLCEDPQWLKEPFTRGQAWVDLLMLANHQDGYIRARGHRVEVKRGEVGWSEVALAHRWLWSRDRVRRYLKELQEIDHQIIHQTNNFSSIITIVNYEIYQGIDTPNKTAKKQQTIQQTDSKQDTNKNEKNEKNEKKIVTDTQFFDSLKINPAYQGLSIEIEKGKCEAWCLAKGRNFTRRMFVNWLNRAEKPIQPQAKVVSSGADFDLEEFYREVKR